MLYIINCSNGTLYSSYQCQGLIKTIPCIHSSLDIVYLGAHDQFIHAISIQVLIEHKVFILKYFDFVGNNFKMYLEIWIK
jgi:hypothetical protein